MAPTHVIADEHRLRVGQTWRDPTGPSVQLITIDKIDPGRTIEGISATEAIPGAVSTGAWAPDQFDEFVLVQDPDWSSYRVIGSVAPGLPEERRVTRSVGVLEGASVQSDASAGFGGSDCCWTVVAPSEGEAVALVKRAIAKESVDVRVA